METYWHFCRIMTKLGENTGAEPRSVAPSSATRQCQTRPNPKRQSSAILRIRLRFSAFTTVSSSATWTRLAQSLLVTARPDKHLVQELVDFGPSREVPKVGIFHRWIARPTMISYCDSFQTAQRPCITTGLVSLTRHGPAPRNGGVTALETSANNTPESGLPNSLLSGV